MSNNELNTSNYHEFLAPLIGKNVTVYRGGPESKTGRLIDVQSDYLTLLVENQQEVSVIYYCLYHVQSISENAKINSIQRRKSSGNEIQGNVVQSLHFHGLLEELVNSYIKVNQGGPEAKQGKIVDITDDYIVLLTEDDGVVFYNIHHIKSIGVQISNEVEGSEVEGDVANKENELHEAEKITEVDEIVSYVHAQNFRYLFNELTNTWVSINRGGPEAIEGILVPGAGDYYTLVNSDEVIRLNPNHIKSISCGPKGVFKQSEKQSNETSQMEDTQQNGKMKNGENKGEVKSEKKDEKKDEKKGEKKGEMKGEKKGEKKDEKKKEDKEK
ncbi:spore coat protein B [Thermolongibacillus altinsuensis]|uniref:Spore coat protein B n=1 Tax=Thermolongibacillus altinsuensis TaxID=575256 RepID=A0A4V2QA94_9BACL|nr:spore coat protein CotH [Thermolongibacillus altinsuensis]TCL49706.1 spore coat protein B [Thermolongibacillus altinsuensis]